MPVTSVAMAKVSGPPSRMPRLHHRGQLVPSAMASWGWVYEADSTSALVASFRLVASLARMIWNTTNAITTPMFMAVPILLPLVSSPPQQGGGAGLAEQGAAEVGTCLVESGEGAVDEQAAGERGPLPQTVDVDPLHRGGG